MMTSSVAVAIAVAVTVTVTVLVALRAELGGGVCEVGDEREVSGGDQAVERHSAPVEVGAGVAGPHHGGAGDACCDGLDGGERAAGGGSGAGGAYGGDHLAVAIRHAASLHRLIGQTKNGALLVRA